MAQWLALLPILVTGSYEYRGDDGASRSGATTGGTPRSCVAGLNAALLVSSLVFFGPLLFPDLIPQVLRSRSRRC